MRRRRRKKRGFVAIEKLGAEEADAAKGAEEDRLEHADEDARATRARGGDIDWCMFPMPPAVVYI